MPPTRRAQRPSVAPGALDALQKKVAALETELANARSKIEGEIKTVRGDVTERARARSPRPPPATAPPALP